MYIRNEHSFRMVNIMDSDKKNRILAATLKLITENGFHGTPVSMIADEASVGSGTIYRYFKNKEAIITELYDIIQKELNDAILKDIPQTISIRDEIFIKWKNILNFYIKNPYKAQFIDQYASSPFVSREVLRKNRKRFSHYDELIKRAINKKVIRKVNYLSIIVLMWGSIQQLTQRHRSGGLAITPKMIDEVFSIFWDGIKV